MERWGVKEPCFGACISAFLGHIGSCISVFTGCPSEEIVQEFSSVRPPYKRGRFEVSGRTWEGKTCDLWESDLVAARFRVLLFLFACWGRICPASDVGTIMITIYRPNYYRRATRGSCPFRGVFKIWASSMKETAWGFPDKRFPFYTPKYRHSASCRSSCAKAPIY